jgi:hypothetical protein
MGVPLKFMDGMDYYEPTDWDELAKYARELSPEDDEADDDDEGPGNPTGGSAADTAEKSSAPGEHGAQEATTT